MILKIENIDYPVIINKKKIKNAYIRVNDKLEIVVSINHRVSSLEIEKLVLKNKEIIKKMIDVENSKNNYFYYLGEKYDIIINNHFFDIDHTNKKVYAADIKMIENSIKKEIKQFLEKRLKYNYEYVGLDVDYPQLKIRKMKTRWGVCNRNNHSITLNFDLYKKTIEEIDYVIIHELIHYKFFDHSNNFWNLVEQYIPNYKLLRKKLKQ